MRAADESVPRTYPRDPWTRLPCEAERSATGCTSRFHAVTWADRAAKTSIARRCPVEYAIPLHLQVLSGRRRCRSDVESLQRSVLRHQFRQQNSTICRYLSPLTDSNRRPPPYHSAPRRDVRARAGSRGHENPANPRNRPQTSDRTCTRVPVLVFPHCSLRHRRARAFRGPRYWARSRTRASRTTSAGG
jgi:hypothetical protein